MTAIVRVKRRIDEEPLSALVLSSKRRRTDAEIGGNNADDAANNSNNAATANGAAAIAVDNKSVFKAILKYVGTIEVQDNLATAKIARSLNKETAKEIIQQKGARQSSSGVDGSTQIAERARAELRKENRFHVVNRQRTTLDTAAVGSNAEDDESSKQTTAAAENIKEITIFDIEKQQQLAKKSIDDAANEAVSQQEQKFVYDVYLPDETAQKNANADTTAAAQTLLEEDNYISVRAIDNLVYEDHYEDSEHESYDSEDSNEENYYANDYPDEEDEANMRDDEDDEPEYATDDGDSGAEMCNAIRNFVLDDDDEDDDDNYYKDAFKADSDEDEHDFYMEASSSSGSLNEYDSPLISTVKTARGFVNDVDFYTDSNPHNNEHDADSDDDDKAAPAAQIGFDDNTLYKDANEMIDMSEVLQTDKLNTSGEDNYHSANEV